MKKSITYLILFLALSSNNYIIAQQKNDKIILDNCSSFYFECVPYPLTIDIGEDDWIVESDSNSVIKRDSSDILKVIFFGESKKSKLILYKYKDNEKTEIASRTFSFKHLPITAYISGVFSGDRVKASLLRNKCLIGGLLNYDIDYSFKVKSFTLVYQRNDSLIEFKVKGNRIDDELFKIIEGLKGEKALIFKDIMIEKYVGIIEPIDPFVIFVY